MTTEDLLNYYYKKDVISLDRQAATPSSSSPTSCSARGSRRDVKDPKSGDVLAREGRKFNKAIVRQLEAAKVSEIPIAMDEMRRAGSRPMTSSTRTPAKCWCRPTRS